MERSTKEYPFTIHPEEWYYAANKFVCKIAHPQIRPEHKIELMLNREDPESASVIERSNILGWTQTYGYVMLYAFGERPSGNVKVTMYVKGSEGNAS